MKGVSRGRVLHTPLLRCKWKGCKSGMDRDLKLLGYMAKMRGGGGGRGAGVDGQGGTEWTHQWRLMITQDIAVADQY